MSIIISQNGKNAAKIEKASFEKENILQEYIHNNPESIPVYEINEDKKLFVIAREFPTESGPIDALAIDKDGDIYIVETKLYKNPDKRTVVAQALDYGASMWKHTSDFNKFVSLLDGGVRKRFGVGFEEKVLDFFGLDDGQYVNLVETMERNMYEGNLKFVVLMDSIDKRLKDMIVYINQNSQFDIFAVQLEYYNFNEYQIVIPKLFGVEVKKGAAMSRAKKIRRRQDESVFLEDAERSLEPDELMSVRKLLEFSKNHAEQLTWGTGATRSSINPRFSGTGSSKSLYTIRSNGELSLNFGWLNENHDAIKCRDELISLIQKYSLFPISPNYKDHFPRYKIGAWYKKTDLFIEVMKELLGIKD